MTPEQLKQGKDKEESIKAETREIVEQGERRNDLESYILSMKNGLSDKYAAFAMPGSVE